MTDREKFLKGVTVICDTREQKNNHIIKNLEHLGVKHIAKKLDFGDYSFLYSNKICDLDFRQSCVVERKANIDELYTNIIDDRGRIEKELQAASCLSRQLVMIVEDCASWQDLKDYMLSEYVMLRDGRKRQDIGLPVYETLDTWRRGNRYNFDVEFVAEKKRTTAVMLETFYRYWHNYRELTKARR